VKIRLSLGFIVLYNRTYSVPPDHSRLGTVLSPQRTQVEAQDLSEDARKTMIISECLTSFAR